MSPVYCITVHAVSLLYHDLSKQMTARETAKQSSVIKLREAQTVTCCNTQFCLIYIIQQLCVLGGNTLWSSSGHPKLKDWPACNCWIKIHLHWPSLQKNSHPAKRGGNCRSHICIVLSPTQSGWIWLCLVSHCIHWATHAMSMNVKFWTDALLWICHAI